MPDEIQVDVSSEDEGTDLVEVLMRHGINAQVSHAGKRWAVNVQSPYEETERIMQDVIAAVERWLPGGRRRKVALHAGGRTYRLGP